MKYSLGIKNSDLSCDFKNGSEIECCGHPTVEKTNCSKEPTKSTSTSTKVSMDFGDCISCSSGSSCVADVKWNQNTPIPEQFIERLNSGVYMVVSISSQSCSSLAVHFNTTQQIIFGKLAAFFKHLGIRDVFDVGFAREISLIETTREFLRRKKSGSTYLPMLTGSCPGFISYAENLHSDYLFPYISTTRSPQQIMGRLVKDYYSTKFSTGPLFHISIMPCAEKRTESNRSHFENDVDLVLTTEELLSVINTKNSDIMSFDPVPSPSIFNSELYGSYGTSGGFLESVFREVAKELYGVSIDKIEYSPESTKDFKEVKLTVDGQQVLKFGLAYGFRHIQSILKGIKQKTSDFDFVEVMACPSGCTNGGGQIVDLNHSPQDFLEKVNLKHSSVSVSVLQRSDALMLLGDWLGNDPSKEEEQLHTSYQLAQATKKKSCKCQSEIQW